MLYRKGWAKQKQQTTKFRRAIRGIDFLKAIILLVTKLGKNLMAAKHKGPSRQST
jgi:hypothetical protein